ncbi:MAG: PASTA domain-containing protein, partial [Clostridia bacterium]|nr:PASTA domain-containing protein [Clostridia bacterium]
MKITKNKNKKGHIRLSALMLSLVFILGVFLASCGGSGEPTTSTEPQKATTSAAPAQSETKASAASNPDALKMPDVIGMKEEDAVTLLKGMGFEVQISRKGSDEYEKGLVFKTDRTVDEELKKGDRVFLYVSKGESTSVDKPRTDPLVEARGYKEEGANKDYKPLNYEVMKAMWLSQ